MVKSSEFSGFYKLPVSDRVKFVKEFASLTDEDEALLRQTGPLSLDLANRMIENVITVLPVPLGIATNFLINGQDHLVPMAIEEPSVVAAASNAARMARSRGGFSTDSTEPIMIGQIQIVDVPDPQGARFEILKQKDKLIKHANDQDPVLVSLGGGATICRFA